MKNAKLKDAKQSNEARLKVEEANRTATWYGRCRHCKTVLRGSMADLMEHKCGQTS